MIKNIFKHFKTVTHHKWEVFKLSIKLRIPFRGLKHDLSKFTPEEFFESAKYYTGIGSPITACKRQNKYSRAWLHHKGVNKHHFEYWYDFDSIDKANLIPLKYVKEIICDQTAAGIVYEKNNWTNTTQLNYYIKNYNNSEIIHPTIKDILLEVYTELSQKGIKKTLTNTNITNIYNKHVNKLNKEITVKETKEKVKI